MGKVSELEGAVLGLVGSQEPCTAYRVRKALMESPSTHWSGSAGAIYPLITRLEASGYVASTMDPADGRGRSLLSLTGKGNEALRSWVLEASEPTVAASIFDGIRARAFFLESLSVKDRARFAEATLHALEVFLQEAQEYGKALEAEGTPFERLAASGGVHAARARVKWMEEVCEFTTDFTS